tara:strand:+ start:277 stop:879 length:603 start_codon:yes stop_codon:yes gene_type:complete
MTQKADERFIPRDFKIPFGPFLRHYERYFQSVKLLGELGIGQKWLDCACGAGYGSSFLSNFCNFVVGYDIDPSAIECALENYKSDHVGFTRDLSKHEEDFDVVISVETIEHMPESDANIFLTTLRKCLNDNGTLVITTPIVKQTNRDPVNEFHFIEYSDKDFKKLLEDANFIVVDSHFVETTFTDGETKDQGYYKCKKNN